MTAFTNRSPQSLDDDLWALIMSLLPTRPPRRFKHPGRKPVDDRVALSGILCTLNSGLPWEMLPAELGCSGMTCWRRLRDWQQAGVWEQLHATLLAELRRREQLDLSRAVVDSSSVRAVLGEKNWTESDGSSQGRLQASFDH